MGLVCCLLAGEGQDNLSAFCPQFCHHYQNRLHAYDAAYHLIISEP